MYGYYGMGYGYGLDPTIFLVLIARRCLCGLLQYDRYDRGGGGKEASQFPGDF